MEDNKVVETNLLLTYMTLNDNEKNIRPLISTIQFGYEKTITYNVATGHFQHCCYYNFNIVKEEGTELKRKKFCLRQ